MKFQKLIIHNVASIVDAEVDFENSVLADTEVFLITGKTGSGKSTILDSICLALYNETPRLANTRMRGNVNEGDNDVSIKDTRMLLRRNTAEAKVVLTFIGSNDVHYEATWSVRRARMSVTGRIQSVQRQLKNIDTGHTLTKFQEIDAEINAAIGLDFNQFCRTTMLAQGDFTRFLNSGDNEKAEILEKITGVDEYSKIGAKIYDVTRQKKNAWEIARNELAAAEREVDGSAGIIDEKLEELKNLESESASLQIGCNSDKAKYDWIVTNNKNIETVNAASARLCEVENDRASEEYKKQELLVSEWQKTIEARGWMAAMKTATDSQRSCNERLERCATQFAEYLGGYDYLQQEICDIEGKIKDIDAFLATESDKVSMYENAQTITATLNGVADAKRVIGERQNSIAALQQKLEGALKSDLTSAEQKWADAKAKLVAIENDVKVLNAEIAALNLSSLRSEQQAKLTLQHNIANAIKAIEQLASEKSARESVRKSLEAQLSDIQEKEKLSEERVEPIAKAKQEMESCKERLDKQSDTIQTFTKSLRLKLQVGDVCPVCLQKVVQQLPDEADLATLVAGLQAEYDAAKEFYDTLFNEKEKLDKDIRVAKGIYDDQLRKFNASNPVVGAEQQAISACGLCDVVIATIDDSVLPQMHKMADDTSARQAELVGLIQQGENKEAELNKLRERESSSRKEVESLNSAVMTAQDRVKEAENQINSERSFVTAKKGEIESAERKVEQMTIAGVWDIDWRQSAGDFIEKLTSSQAMYNKAVGEKQTLGHQFDSLVQDRENIETSIRSIKQQMPSWDECELQEAKKVENLCSEFNTLSSQISVEKMKLADAVESYNSNQQSLNTFFAEDSSMSVARLEELALYAREYIEAESRKLQAARDEYTAAKTTYENAQAVRDQHQQTMPSLAENDNLESLKERLDGYDARRSEIDRQSGAIKQEIANIRKNEEKLNAYVEEELQKRGEYQKWERLSNLIGDDKGSKFRTIAQSYVLASLIHSANSYMRTLTDRYTLKVDPGTFVIYIEDAYQGYVSRAVTTISGGESFLVSLSLALALSDIEDTLSVDTLFIDEGFGTLSGEPLQNAIRTLRSLHTKAGRHVGIISHIEELCECIPVQIQVSQDGNNSHSTIKVIDKRS